MGYKTFKFCLVFISFITQTHGQLIEIDHLETNIPKNTQYQYQLSNLGKEGLLLFFKDNHYKNMEGKYRQWYFQKYDTTFYKNWEKVYEVEEKWEYNYHYTNIEYTYLLFTKLYKQDILILKIQNTTGEAESFLGNTLVEININDFKVIGQSAFLIGKLKDKTTVVNFNFFDQKCKIVPDFYDNALTIESTFSDEQAQKAYMAVSKRKLSGCKMYVKSFLSDGKPNGNVILKTTKRRGLINAQILPDEENDDFVIGTFGKRCTNYAQGIYLAKLNSQNEQELIRYHYFNYFRNFFNYMPLEQVSRLRKRISQKQKRNKEVTHNYQVFLHPIVLQADTLIVAGEVYTPEYRTTYTNPYTGYSNYGSMRGMTQRILTGFHYKHAFVCALDKRGNVLWDNMIKTKDFTSDVLAAHTQIATQVNYTILAQLADKKISYKAVEKNKTIQEGEFNYKDKDRKLDIDDPKLISWYNDVFLYYDVRNLTNFSDKFFYMSKLQYKFSQADEKSKTKE